MQDSSNDTFVLNKRQICNRQYDTPPPPDSGSLDQLHEQEKPKNKLHNWEVWKKNPKTVVSITEPTDPWDGATETVPKDSKDKIKGNERLGNKTDQAEQ